MAKFCKYCGAPLEEGAFFCTSCGKKIEENEAPAEETVKQEEPAQETPKQEESYTGPVVTPVKAESIGGETYYSQAPKQDAPAPEEKPAKDTRGIEERNIALCILFSIITCGIYGLYWMYKLNDELNRLTEDEHATSGGMVILLSLVTCGIYSWYWCYKMGEKVDQLTNSDSNKVLFIVLAIFQLSIVNLAIMQDTVNKELK